MNFVNLKKKPYDHFNRLTSDVNIKHRKPTDIRPRTGLSYKKIFAHLKLLFNSHKVRRTENSELYQCRTFVDFNFLMLGAGEKQNTWNEINFIATLKEKDVY